MAASMDGAIRFGPMRIADSQVLVTGASGGLGQAIARALHARGARLVLTGRRRDALDALADELGARVVVADLAERDDVRRLAAEATEVNVLVANAGLPGYGRLEAGSEARLDRVLDVNLRAPLVLSQALIPGMLARGRGHLVYISSLQGKTATPGAPLYIATKFALRGLALGLRTDLHGSGVGVSCIFPGFIRDAGIFADSGARLPPGVGTRAPGDVGDAVVEAIERDAAEIDVAPLHLRAGATFAGVAPDVAARFMRLAGGDRIAAAVTGDRPADD